MKRRVLLLILLLCTACGISVAQNDDTRFSREEAKAQRDARRKAAKEAKDTLKPIYPVSQLVPENIEDTKQQPLNLRTPANIKIGRASCRERVCLSV